MSVFLDTYCQGCRAQATEYGKPRTSCLHDQRFMVVYVPSTFCFFVSDTVASDAKVPRLACDHPKEAGPPSPYLRALDLCVSGAHCAAWTVYNRRYVLDTESNQADDFLMRGFAVLAKVASQKQLSYLEIGEMLWLLISLGCKLNTAGERAEVLDRSDEHHLRCY
eukprot:6474233-Amphidinium_carterae.1